MKGRSRVAVWEKLQRNNTWGAFLEIPAPSKEGWCEYHQNYHSRFFSKWKDYSLRCLKLYETSATTSCYSVHLWNVFFWPVLFCIWGCNFKQNFLGKGGMGSKWGTDNRNLQLVFLHGTHLWQFQFTRISKLMFTATYRIQH